MTKDEKQANGETSAGVRHPHDALIKRSFGDAEHAAGELKAVLPASLVSAIDWATLAVEPQAPIDSHLQLRQMDMLYSVTIKGHPALLYTVFEAQRTVDKSMSLRLLIYMARIWDDWMRSRGNEWPPPPIVPLVLYHGEGHWNRSTQFDDLFELGPELYAALKPFIPKFSFLLDDLSSLPDDDLKQRELTARAMLVLAALKHGPSPRMHPDFWVAWQEPVRALLAQEGGPDELLTVLWYILQVNAQIDQEQLGDVMLKHFGPKAEEVAVTAGQRLIQQGRQEGRQEGRQQGRQEGRQEGQTQMLLKLLRLRFGELSPEITARVKASDEQALERLSERVLSAPTLSSVFDDS
tara:strand:- start:60157 stop:61209 length:1053 start_codon:yes stop_codon:yes gene_type:complete